jgi:hypothetical protein
MEDGARRPRGRRRNESATGHEPVDDDAEAQEQ